MAKRTPPRTEAADTSVATPPDREPRASSGSGRPTTEGRPAMSSEQAQTTGRESDTTSTQEPAPQSADTFAARPETDESRRETGSSSGADAEPESTEFGPTEDEIRYRAYLFYIERGSEHGMDFEDWVRAERELRNKR